MAERASILRTVSLPDGRLAWPVAQANGISEATFRARLKRGLAPDEAANEPVIQRDYQGARRRRMAYMLALAERQARMSARLAVGMSDGLRVGLDARRDEYGAVVAVDGDERVAISPNGAAYLLQRRDGVRWVTCRSATVAAVLRQFACVYSDALAAALGSMPNDPRQGLALMRGIKRA